MWWPARYDPPAQVLPHGGIRPEDVAGLHVNLDWSSCFKAEQSTSGPRLARAPPSARSAPTTRARDTSSSATSLATAGLSAMASLASKSASQGWRRHPPPHSDLEAVVGDTVGVEQPTWRHSSANNRSSSWSDASSARAAPGDLPITSRPAPLPVGRATNTRGPARQPRRPAGSCTPPAPPVRRASQSAPDRCCPPGQPPPGPVGEIPVPPLTRDASDEQPLPGGSGGQEPGRASGIRASLRHHLSRLEPAVEEGTADTAG